VTRVLTTLAVALAALAAVGAWAATTYADDQRRWR